jgi:heat shock protein HslJ
MKRSYPLWFILLMLLMSCSGAKQSKSDTLFGHAWQLEYIDIAVSSVDLLFPDKKPEITFEKESGKVTGNSGCNGYNAPYSIDETGIQFGEPGPSTLMYCGEGENHFRKFMRAAEQWNLTADGKLELLTSGAVVLRFKKTTS